jgi:hypothetical protein
MENTTTAGGEIKHMVIILFAVFGALGILLVCAFGGIFWGVHAIDDNQKQYAASTAIAQATQVAGYQFFDDFHNNVNDWDSGYQKNDFWYGTLNIQDDMYIWNIKEFYDKDGVMSWRDYGKNQPVDDFDVSVDGKLATPEAGHMCYGLSFRSSDIGEYIYSVCDGQSFSVRYNEEGPEKDEFLQPWTLSSAIRPGEWNTLAINARGDHFVLWVNNVIVFEFTDARLPSGKVSLLLIAYDDIPGTILFDNFGLQPR